MYVPLRLSENRTIVPSGIATGLCVRAYFALASRLFPEIAGRDFLHSKTAGLPEELPVPPRPVRLD